MPQVRKLPIEYFCQELENLTEQSQLSIQQQYCRFLRATCNKPRKSEPEIKVGICSLGSPVARSEVNYPVIICPQRLKEEVMFRTIEEKYLTGWNNVQWVQEVDMGVGGSVDYVAFELDEKGKVTRFQCVELQAAGTTGSPYPFAVAMAKKESINTLSATFGINWANEFTKTMMQQALKKGRIVEAWGKKIIFVIQDVAMMYLQATSDCSLLEDENPELPVDFCTFKMVHGQDGWHLSFDRIYSTSIDGIIRIIAGADNESYPTTSDFISKIKTKAADDGVLDNEPLFLL